MIRSLEIIYGETEQRSLMIFQHTWCRFFHTDRFLAKSDQPSSTAPEFSESTRDVDAPGNFDKQFFGERFSLDDLRSFKPDVTIDGRTNLEIGETRIEVIPVHGGGTHDAMFIHLPDQGVLFVGDFIMPYLGEPLWRKAISRD